MSKVRPIAEAKKPATKKKAAASRSTTTKKKTTTKVATTKKKVVAKKPAPKKTVVRRASTQETATPKKIKKAKPVMVDVTVDQETAAVFDTPSYRPDYQLSDNTVYSQEDLYQEEDDAFGFDLSDNNDDYDKQRKFFSEFIKDESGQDFDQDMPPVTAVTPRKTSVKLYRRQAAVYLGATLILILAVLYFFFIKLTVYIYPQGEVVNDNTTFTVTSATETESPFPIVRGEAKLTELSAEKVYRITNEPQEENDENCRVVGTVTLYNKLSRLQPLVATTRLLAGDGRLYRLERGVTLPANGQLTANVYADKIGKDQLITDPTKFTVPGLAASLSEIVYAENTQAFRCQDQAAKSIITQGDLDKAKVDIEAVLDEKAKNDFRPAAGQAVTYDEVPGSFKVEFNVKVGDQRDELIATAKKSYTLARFAQDDVLVLAKNRMAMLMSDDKQLTGFDAQSLAYTLESYNLSPSEANVKVYFSGVMSLKENTVLVDRKKLVGLNEKQISEYLHQFPEVRDYRLEFWPPFIKNAPQLPDKITVKVAE